MGRAPTTIESTPVSSARLRLYHIPVCPFCQRIEILMALKGLDDRLHRHVVDVTVPRPGWLLKKTGGSTMLPVLEDEQGRILRESLVILQYLEDRFPVPSVARQDPYERAVEQMLCAHEREFTTAGYLFVMNRDPARRAALREDLLQHYRRIDAFLRVHSPHGPFLHDRFGWAEAVFTPIFMRFWFLDYYEDFELPDDAAFARVRQWRDACLAHPAAQQVSREEIVKLYYDYAKGAGNGALLPGRRVSSFAFEPHWRARPWPPRDKYVIDATDAELGLA